LGQVNGDKFSALAGVVFEQLVAKEPGFGDNGIRFVRPGNNGMLGRMATWIKNEDVRCAYRCTCGIWRRCASVV
jgi:hypothetical protein